MIILSDGWAIDSDNMQYVLGKPIAAMVKDKPVKQMQSASYHATLEQAFTAFLRRMQREVVKSNDLSVEDAIQALQGAHNGVMAMFGNVESIKEGK